MQFLKILFWVVVAVSLYGFAASNWNYVTLSLWGDILIDIKVPLLMAATFLLGFLPTWIVMRGRLWRVKRLLQGQERQRVAPEPAVPVEEPIP